MEEQPSIDIEHLSELLEPPDELHGHEWSPADLSQMLRHQLETRLVTDLARVEAGDVDGLIISSDAAPLDTFADLFRHPSPPAELLLRVKNFAKLADAPPEPSLPRPIATVIYYAALAAGLVRMQQRLTSLPVRHLVSGFRWAAERHWMDPELRELLQAAAVEAEPPH